MSDFNTCGLCFHARAVPNELSAIQCWEGPPSVVLIPQQMGTQTILRPQNVRPCLPRREPACGAFKMKLDLEATTI